MAQFSNHLKILPTKPTTKIQEAKLVKRPRYVRQSVRKREVGVAQASQPHFITVQDFSRFSSFVFHVFQDFLVFFKIFRVFQVFFAFFKFSFYAFQDFFAFSKFFSRFSRVVSFFKIFLVFQVFSRFSRFIDFFKFFRVFQNLSSFSRFIEKKEKLSDDTHRTRYMCIGIVVLYFCILLKYSQQMTLQQTFIMSRFLFTSELFETKH